MIATILAWFVGIVAVFWVWFIIEDRAHRVQMDRLWARARRGQDIQDHIKNHARNTKGRT